MGRDAVFAGRGASTAARFQLALMLIVVAVQAQELPVAAVGRIVAVIVIAVMDRQLANVGMSEFTGAAAADPGVDLERLLPITLFALLRSAPRFGRPRSRVLAF